MPGRRNSNTLEIETGWGPEVPRDSRKIDEVSSNERMERVATGKQTASVLMNELSELSSPLHKSSLDLWP